MEASPSTDEWVKKMWHIYTMEYYSAIKRNKTELSVVRWMDLESVIQSEVSQREKSTMFLIGTSCCRTTQASRPGQGGWFRSTVP